MKVYVSDAVAFFYYLLDQLPPKADEAFRQAEKGDAILYLPTIVAAELYYLFEKKRWLKMWRTFRNAISKSAAFRYYPFDERVLNLFTSTKAKEIHDKIIVSTVKALNADALITKDEEIIRLKEVAVIWG